MIRNEIVKCDFQTNGDFPEGFSIALYDYNSGEIIDASSFDLRIGNELERKFKLIVGKPGFIEKEINRIRENMPEKFELFPNYPNPFNPETTIKYSLSKYGFVTLKIYDILGAEIRTLVERYQQPGNYVYNFNGEGLSSGVYIYRLISGDFVSARKMTLVK